MINVWIMDWAFVVLGFLNESLLRKMYTWLYIMDDRPLSGKMYESVRFGMHIMGVMSCSGRILDKFPLR